MSCELFSRDMTCVNPSTPNLAAEYGPRNALPSFLWGGYIDDRSKLLRPHQSQRLLLHKKVPVRFVLSTLSQT